MKIGFMGYNLTPVSGHARTIFEIGTLLEKRGKQVVIITDTLDEDGRRLLTSLSREQGFSFKIKESGKRFHFQSFFEDPEFEKIIRSLDIVHAFDMQAVRFLREYFQKKKIRIPLLYSISTFPKFDLQSFFSGSYVATRLWDRTDPSFLYSFLFPSFLLPWIYQKPDYFVATCNALKDYLVTVGVSGEKITVIYPGVNAKIFSPRPGRSGQKIFQIFYYGWLSDIRGVSDLLEAFKEFHQKQPDSQLVFSTPEPQVAFSTETKMLVRKIQQASQKHPIRLLEYRPDISKVLEDSDLVVLPFKGRFGYLHPPMTLLETIFKKRVFLTRRIASVCEIVKESKLLVASHERLVDKIKDVFNHYDSYQQEVEKCYQRVAAQMTVEAIAEQYQNLYEKLCSQDSRYGAGRFYSQKQVAESYDRERFSSLGGRLFDGMEKQILLSHIPKNKDSSILDVGSGTGRLILAIAQRGYKRLAAVDISEPLLEVLSKKARDEGFLQGIKTTLGDIYHLPYPSQSRDCVFSFRVLNQLGSDKNREDALGELIRLLKPGGRLIFDIMNKHSFAFLKPEFPHMSVGKIKEILQTFPELKMRKVIHRMSFSQTLMEKSPWPFPYLICGIDILFSTLFPFWGTRVYFVVDRQ